MDDPLVNFKTTEGTIAEILKVMQFVYAADLRKVLTPVMFITGEEDPEEHFGKDTIRLNRITVMRSPGYLEEYCRIQT